MHDTACAMSMHEWKIKREATLEMLSGGLLVFRPHQSSSHRGHSSAPSAASDLSSTKHSYFSRVCSDQKVWTNGLEMHSSALSPTTQTRQSVCCREWSYSTHRSVLACLKKRTTSGYSEGIDCFVISKPIYSQSIVKYNYVVKPFPRSSHFYFSYYYTLLIMHT